MHGITPATSPLRFDVMQARTICYWKHDSGDQFTAAEKSTRRVLTLTILVMLMEIVAGFKLHSMALLADGWHMATHVAAFLITVAVYALTRRHAQDDSFSFGTGKISVLGAFTSSIALGGIGLFMAVESVLRLFDPKPIRFNEAIAIGCLGLGFNLVSALLLRGHQHLDCVNHQGCEHHPGSRHQDASNGLAHDLNLKAAYLHVLADAVTSLLAIAALFGGKLFGWAWLDPVIGLAGAAVVAQWAYGLLRDTTNILLDREPENSNLHADIRRIFQADSAAVITDLHVWQIATKKYAAIISVVAPEPKTPSAYKELLRRRKELVHVTVEVHRRDLRDPVRWGSGMTGIGLANSGAN